MDIKLESALKKMEQSMLQTLINQQMKPKRPNFTQTKIPFHQTKEFKEMQAFFAKDSMIDTFRQVCPPSTHSDS